MTDARPVVLVICDGWGYSPEHVGNAIAAARTPEMDALQQQWPSTVVAASGVAVGLPASQQGNSEVGHLTIGTGRVLNQSLTRITAAIADESFFTNPVLCRAMDDARARGVAVHCLGLISSGGVHSEQDHAVVLAALAKQRGCDQLFFHVFTDGRDVAPMSGAESLGVFCDALERVGVGRIASVSGRYYAMDRDHRWERTARAYDVLTLGVGATATDPVAYIQQQYAVGVTDEFVVPASIVEEGKRPTVIADGDVVICFNFRPDRMRQLVHALVDERCEGFDRKVVRHNLSVVTLTEYDTTLPVDVAFPKEVAQQSIAEVVSAAGLSQFHIAETEKYAHVTYFLNGGREEPFAGEERMLIPSLKVATYDSAPEMRANEITDAVVSRIRDGDDAFIVVNFANADMVGHTGVFRATVSAVEIVDRCIGRIADATLERGGALLITADHGNAEMKIDRSDGSPLTAHTTSPVPVIVCGTTATKLRQGGGLRDIAPTLLGILGVDIPVEMMGQSLMSA